MSPVTKEEYRAPSQIIDQEVERLGIAKPQAAVVVSPAPLLGTWINVDHNTRDLVRVVIAQAGNEITVHAFGACSPNPCDWGQMAGMVYSESVSLAPAVAFTTQYKFGFSEVIMTGHLYEGAMFVECFTHFTDNSGRADYYSMDIMSK